MLRLKLRNLFKLMILTLNIYCYDLLNLITLSLVLSLVYEEINCQQLYCCRQKLHNIE